jgi:hypothetical protein
MAFTKNTFTGNTVADASLINENFAEIYTSLAAFPSTNAAIASEAVDTEHIASGAVTLEKINGAVIETKAEGGAGVLLGTDQTLPTSLAVKDYVDAKVAEANQGFGGYYASGGSGDSFGNVTLGEYWVTPASNWNGTYYEIPYAGNYSILIWGGFGMYKSTTVGVRIKHWIKADSENPVYPADSSYYNSAYTTAGVEYKFYRSAGTQELSCAVGDRIYMQGKGTGSSHMESGHMSIYKVS